MVNGEPLSRVPIPSSCHPAVRDLPNGRRNETRSACKSWKRLNASACLTSKLDGPLSALASSGFSGAVCATAPDAPVMNPPMTALESSIDFENRSEEHTSEFQSPCNIVCRLLLEKKKRTVERVREPYPSRDSRRPRTSALPSRVR